MALTEMEADRQTELEAAVEVDAEDRVVFWSRDAERLLGIRATTARGRRLFELLEAHDVWGNRTSGHGLHEARQRGEPMRPFLIDGRSGSGEEIRLVVRPRLPAAAPHTGAALAFLLRRDLRRSQDRRRPSHVVGRRGLVLPSIEPAAAPLSRRELEVLRLLAAGSSTAGIARKLGIAPATARNHIQHLLDDLNTHSRLAAVAIARERGWLD